MFQFCGYTATIDIGLITACQQSEGKITCQIVTLIAVPSNHFSDVIITDKTECYDKITAKLLLWSTTASRVSNWYLTLLLRIVTPRPIVGKLHYRRVELINVCSMGRRDADRH